MKTHQIIVLDRSGSMSACRAETIAGFNRVVGEVSAAAEGADVRVTLVVFNEEVAFAAFCEPTAALQPLTPETYVPGGATAMLDAVGFALDRFATEVGDDKETRYVVVVVSDGEENASRRYDYPAIASMINARQSTGRWTFAYVGANQDLSEVSRRMEIPRRNMVCYAPSREGTQDAFGAIAESSFAMIRGDSMSSAEFFGGGRAGSTGKGRKRTKR
jgi:Mg-chelatase subunit ChlD